MVKLYLIAMRHNLRYVVLVVQLIIAISTISTCFSIQTYAETKTIPSGGNLRVGLIATGPLMYIEGYSVTSAGPAILTNNVGIPHETFACFAPNGTLIPLVAESWNMSKDGLSYTFKIRKNAKWSDGTDVTVADVRFRYELLKVVPGSDEWGIAPYIDRIEAPDNKTFTIWLKQPFSPFLYYWLVLSPSPAHYWKTVDNFMSADAVKAKETIGTGPFKIVGFSAGDKVIRLVPNKYYWGPKPYLSNVTITLLSSDANIPTLMATKEFDIIEVPSSSQVSSLVSIEGVSVAVFSNKSYGGWAMARWAGVLTNCLKYPLSQVDFRKAEAYGIDRQQIVNLVVSGYGNIASYGFLPSDYAQWLAPGLPIYPRNVTRAKALISGLGFNLGSDGFWRYSNGTRLTLELMARGGDELLIATIMAQQLKDIGLDVSVKSLSSSVYTDNLFLGYYDQAVILTNHPLVMDFVMNKFYYPTVLPIGTRLESYRGYDRWANARYGQLMELSRSVTNIELSHGYYNEAQAILADNLPFLSLYYSKHIWAYRTDTFEGWEKMRQGYNWPMNELTLNVHLPAVLVTPSPTPVATSSFDIVPYAVAGVCVVVAATAIFYAMRKRQPKAS